MIGEQNTVNFQKEQDYKVDSELEDVQPRHNEKPGSNVNKQKTNIPFSEGLKKIQ